MLALITWFGWGRFSYLVRDDPAAKLQAESLAGVGLRTVSLGQLTDFEWERVAFFGPYTRRDVVNKALGFGWPDFDDSRINFVDFYSLIVFTNAQQVKRWWKLRRCAPDIDNSLNGVAISREQATFSLRNGETCSVLLKLSIMRSNHTPNPDARKGGARRLA